MIRIETSWRRGHGEGVGTGMERAVGAVDLHFPVARIAAVVELIVDLAAVDEGQLGRGAGDDCPLRVDEGQRVAARKLLPNSCIA